MHAPCLFDAFWCFSIYTLAVAPGPSWQKQSGEIWLPFRWRWMGVFLLLPVFFPAQTVTHSGNFVCRRLEWAWILMVLFPCCRAAFPLHIHPFSLGPKWAHCIVTHFIAASTVWMGVWLCACLCVCKFAFMIRLLQDSTRYRKTETLTAPPKRWVTLCVIVCYGVFPHCRKKSMFHTRACALLLLSAEPFSLHCNSFLCFNKTSAEKEGTSNSLGSRLFKFLDHLHVFHVEGSDATVKQRYQFGISRPLGSQP